MAARNVLVPMLGKQLGERPLPVPPAPKAQTWLPQFGQQCCRQSKDLWLENPEVSAPGVVNALTQTPELRLPEPELLQASPSLQERIALAQRTPVFAPPVQAVMFHMEHSPIQEPPTDFCRARDQRMASWLEAHGRTHFQQRGQRRAGLAVYLHTPLSVTARQPQPMPAVLPDQVHKQIESGPIPLDQRITCAGPEGMSVRQKVDGFQNGGLACAIGADQPVEGRLRHDLHRLGAADVVRWEERCVG